MDWTRTPRSYGYKRLHSDRDDTSWDVRAYRRGVKRRITNRRLWHGVKRFSRGAASAARRMRLAGARAGAAVAGRSAAAAGESEGLLEGIEMTTYGAEAAEAAEGTAIAGECVAGEEAAAALGPVAAAIAALGIGAYLLWRHFHKKHTDQTAEDNDPSKPDPPPEDTDAFIGSYPPIAVAYLTNRRSPYTDGSL